MKLQIMSILGGAFLLMSCASTTGDTSVLKTCATEQAMKMVTNGTAFSTSFQTNVGTIAKTCLLKSAMPDTVANQITATSTATSALTDVMNAFKK